MLTFLPNKIRITFLIIFLCSSGLLFALSVRLELKARELQQESLELLNNSESFHDTNRDIRKFLYSRHPIPSPSLIRNSQTQNNNTSLSSFDTISAQSNSYFERKDTGYIRSLLKSTPSAMLNLWFDSTLTYESTIEIWEGTTVISNPAKIFDYRITDFPHAVGSGIPFKPISVKDGFFVVNVNIHDYRNNLIACIINNKVFMNKYYHGYFNHDHKGIEVLDSMENVAFSIDLQDPNKIFIQGYYLDQVGVLFYTGLKSAGNGTEGTKDKNEDVVALGKSVGVKKLFDYSYLVGLGKRLK